MNSRQRLQTTLNHQQPDRVCVDFGATFVTGIHVAVVDKLNKAVLGSNDSPREGDASRTRCWAKWTTHCARR